MGQTALSGDEWCDFFITRSSQWLLTVQRQVRTPPVRPADGVVGWFYESFVPGEDCCELGLRAKIKSAETRSGRDRALSI